MRARDRQTPRLKTVAATAVLAAFLASTACTAPKSEADLDGGAVSRDAAVDASVDRDGSVFADAAMPDATVPDGAVSCDGCAPDAGCPWGGCAGDPWPRLFGGAGNDEAHGIAVRAGQVFVGGHFNGTADFGVGRETARAGDAFVLRLDATDATTDWAHAFGGAGIGASDFPGDLVTDVELTEDGVVVTGAFTGAMQVTPDAPVLPWVNSFDLFVARFDESGAHRWSQAIGAVTWIVGRSVSVRGNSVLVVGERQRGLPGSDGVLARRDALTGAATGSSELVLLDGTGVSLLWSVAHTASGFCVGGCFTGPATFFARGYGSTLSADTFVSCYDASEAFVGTYTEMRSGLDCATDLAVASDGSVSAVGFREAGAARELFVATGIAVSGAMIVQHHPSNADAPIAYAALGPADDLFVAIPVVGSVEIDGVPLAPRGGEDIVVARYSQRGEVVWARRFGGVGDDAPQEIAFDGDSYVFVSGYMTDAVDFEGHTRRSHGGRDGLVLRLDADSGAVR